MKRFKSLSRYQKNILILITAMVLVFTVLYPITISRVGYAYKNAILIPHQENGNTVYTGKIQGKQASFTVSADKTVVFQYGDKTYGPYIVKEDPTAIPENEEMAGYLTGIELRQGDKILFRGGVLNQGEYRWLYDETGNLENTDISMTINGIEMDEDGNVVDPVQPSVSTILELTAAPDLTHKGEWVAWFAGVFVCIVTALSILFADELFHLFLSLRICNAEQVEPSDLEIAGRYIAWTVLPIMAMVLFIIGLQ